VASQASIGWSALQIIPSLKGATEQLTGPMQRAGRQAGDAAGKAIADGITAAKGQVEKASQAIGAARQKEADAAGKVRVAEAQLQTLRDKGITDAGRLAQAEERLEAAKRRHGTTIDALKGKEDQLAGAQARLERAQSDTHQAQLDASGSAKKYGDAVDNMGEQVMGGAGKLKQMAIGLAGISSAAEAVHSAMDWQSVTAKMNAQLGASGKLAEGYGKTAGDLYKRGLGDSMEGVAEAVQAAASAFPTLGSEGEVSLDRAAERAVNLAKVFDVDVAEATQTAS